MPEPDPEVTEDRLLGGRVTLFQPRRGHRAGTDAVLLAGLADVRPGDLVADLGAATGAVGLMIAAREPASRLVLVERDPDLAALAVQNSRANHAADRAEVIRADLFWPASARTDAGLRSGQADHVVTNPPFFEGEGRPSPEARRRSAHEMEGGGLAEWIASAADLLRHRGRIAVIYRADGLRRCLAALERRFGSVIVTPVHPRAGEAASRILVSAVKGGRAPLQLASPIILHEADGSFTPAAAALHGSPT